MKVKLADGTEMEVLTPEEIKSTLEEVKENAKKEALEEFKKLKPEEKPLEKSEDKKPEEKKEEKVDLSTLVAQEVNKFKAEESFKGFTAKIGTVEGIDMSVFSGLNSAQYEAIVKLADKKKVLADADFEKLVEEKATEKAKKILEDNGKPKHEQPKFSLKDIKKY